MNILREFEQLGIGRHQISHEKKINNHNKEKLKAL